VELIGKAIAINPGDALACYNQGTALHQLSRLEAALASYDRAVAIRSDDPRVYVNRATAHQQLMQGEAALADCELAIALKSDYADAYYNRALIRLLAGDFEHGWVDHEWRWHRQLNSSIRERRDFPQPLWIGNAALSGKRIVLHGEQGLGDTLQFCRYVTDVAALGAHVILEVPRVLAALLSTLEGVSELVLDGEGLPEFDCYCPLMSLPLAFGTRLSSVPGRVPYLRADADKTESWRRRLGEKRALRVGLVWSGGFRPNQREVWSVNRRRNIPLRKLAILKHPAVEYFSLQKGPAAESELAECLANGWDGPAVTDFSHELHDFSDTAALIEQLDLVISVDTSTAHLAGALGKPVWLLNRFDTCWRWLRDRTDSPWYPTMKIYRQASAGDWDEVIGRVREDLFQLL
jgi:hypothetical protein